MLILAVLLVFGLADTSETEDESTDDPAYYDSEAGEDDEECADCDKSESTDDDKSECEDGSCSTNQRTSKRNNNKSDADKYYNGDDKDDKNNVKPGE